VGKKILTPLESESLIGSEAWHRPPERRSPDRYDSSSSCSSPTTVTGTEAQPTRARYRRAERGPDRSEYSKRTERI